MMKLFFNRFQIFYNYRHLLQELVEKDIKLKYRRSFLGYLWSILNPLLTMLVLVAVFSQLFRFDIENFPVYLLCAQLLFNFMMEATNQAVFSIWGNAALLKKVYVPKYIFTLSKITSSLVNMLFSLIALLIVMFLTNTEFTGNLIFVPVILLQLYVFCIGLGFFLAQASVFFRDVQYIYAVLTTAWTYLTPMFYPIDILPQGLKNGVMALNPMYFYIEQFRSVVLYGVFPAADLIIKGCAVAILFLIVGMACFLKTQDKFILYI